MKNQIIIGQNRQIRARKYRIIKDSRELEASLWVFVNERAIIAGVLLI